MRIDINAGNHMGYKTITSERGKNSQGDTIISPNNAPTPHTQYGIKIGHILHMTFKHLQ